YYVIICAASSLIISPDGYHPDLPSFPTRRSSDLSEQFKHWKPNDATHTIFEAAIYKGDNFQFAITFKIVYAPYQYDIKQMEIVTDRKSTRLNSSHVKTSYAVFCLKKNSNLLSLHS